MIDFGLLVSRFNTTTPSISTDNTLRELRIDGGGRVAHRNADGNDNTLSYFADGDAVGTGVGTVSGVVGDRGTLILGRDSVDSIYKAISVNSDGSVNVAFNAGTDQSQAADHANATEGDIALTSGTWVLIQSKAVSTGHMHIAGWSYDSDKNTKFQLALTVSLATPVRADITEILDTQITSSSRPSDHVGFTQDLTRAGAANTFLCVFAKQLQAGAGGSAGSMMNFDTTT